MLRRCSALKLNCANEQCDDYYEFYFTDQGIQIYITKIIIKKISPLEIRIEIFSTVVDFPTPGLSSGS